MRFAYLCLCVGVAACTAPAPHLAVAPSVLSDSWSGSVATGGLTRLGGDFWQGFGSPAIKDVVERALVANPTIDAARARVAAARGQARIANAALLPTVNANAGLTATRTDNTNIALYSYSVGQAGIDIAYDVDLFGGARAGRRAARNRAMAASYDTDAAALVVETDAARSLVQWAAFGDRIAVADRDILSARDLLRILNVRLREGATTRVEVGLQSSEVARLEGQRSTLAEARARMAASIAALTGEEAPRYTPPSVTLAMLTTPTVDPGQPGDLLFNRPDIRAAEARISAARGDVAQARAAFKPSLHLSASALVQAAAIGGPFGLTLSAGSSLLAPIFQGGRLRGQLEIASATQVETVALYREALLRALSEGDQALAGLAESTRRIDIYTEAANAAHTSSRLARMQYLEGEISLDSLIQTERNESQTADAALVAHQDKLLAIIDLYKSLGGVIVTNRRL